MTGLDGMVIFAIHPPEPERLEKVTREMRLLGPPTIRVVDCGDRYQALEGSQRLAAAHALGVAPRLVIYAQDELIDISYYDWYDPANWAAGADITQYTAGEVAAQLFSAYSAREYRFGN
jgi:hypothetical protein